MTIAITGASGQFGRLVVAKLLQRTEPDELVLLTREPSALEGNAPGVEVRAADFADPDTLPTAFAGVDKLLLISIDVLGPRRVELQSAAIDAAKAAGVRHVIYTSLPETGPGNPAGVAPDHQGTEDALTASGLTWTMLRNNLYADMQVDRLRQAADSGQLVTNTGDGATAFVTRADCAAVAAAVLTSDGHDNASYDVTGPDALTPDDLAALASDLGSAVEGVRVDDAAYVAGLEQAGLPPEAAELLASFGAGSREGYFDTVTEVVPRLTGRPATALRDLLNG